MSRSFVARSRSFLGRIAAAIGLGASLALISATPLAAQEINPLDVAPDANGVDLLRAKAQIRLPELSIPAAPELTFKNLSDFLPLLEGELVPGSQTGGVIYSVNAGGAARPTVVNEYTLRTAYIKNSAGAPVAAGPPISLLTMSYTCLSSATCDASTPAADKVVTEYDCGPTTGLNILLLRGIAVTAVNDQGQSQTLRTCYGYNYFGERISETLPKAGLSSCPA